MTASTPHSTHDVNYFFSVWAESFFSKPVFSKSNFYNSRIGKSSLSFYNFGIELLPNIFFVSLESPLKNSVTWYAYLKMLVDIPHYDGAGHIFATKRALHL